MYTAGESEGAGPPPPQLGLGGRRPSARLASHRGRGRAQLEAVLRLENETERKLAIAAVIDDVVRDLGFRAIVIGGVAVEFWTRGAYSTADIDLYLPHGPAVDERLAALGLRPQGRHWIDAEHDVFVEAPASFPAADEEVAEVRLSTGQTALVLSPEDPDIDDRRLRRRADQERLDPALTELGRLAERVAAGEVLESYELHEVAEGLRQRF